MNKLFKTSLWSLVVLVGLLSSMAYGAVWENTQAWTPEQEDHYSQWIEENWEVDVFTNPQSPYYGLEPDCADAVYSARIVYAFEHGLPFGIQDPTQPRNKITNSMNRYNRLSQIQRVKAFINYIYRIAGTQTLGQDTYAVPINRQHVRAGVVILEHEKKHSFIIKTIKDTGAPRLYYSTYNHTDDLIVRRSFPSLAHLFPTGIKAPNGLRAFRQPQYIGQAEWRIPNYSNEQYEFEYLSWKDEVMARLATRPERAHEHMIRLLSDLCGLLYVRVGVVDKAIEYKERIGRRCMNYSEYDLYSTPSRDDMMKELYKTTIARYKRGLRERSRMSDNVHRYMKSIIDGVPTKTCPVAYDYNKKIDIGEFYQRLKKGYISSNPHDPIAYRWGEVPTLAGAPGASCPTY